MSSGFTVGHFVEFAGAPGIGRVGAVIGDALRVDFFESVAEPELESRMVPAADCRHVRLKPETRVFRRNPSTGEWQAGRVRDRIGGQYYIRFPNFDSDLPVPESQLRVRWDKPVRDPLQVLVSGGNESGYLYDTRLPMLHNLTAQRAASAGISAFLSSAVEIFPHQVNAALTVLSDPVQRYLLADEVGLGKTIEAGYVIRQTLIDSPQARVIVVAPDPLRRQWQTELRDKFFTEDFPGPVTITSHETPEKWEKYHESDLVVVDEAHLLVQDRDDTDEVYQALCRLAHSASKLLLLSATPVTSSYTTHLGLLHLLDRDMYRWSDREAFEHRYNRRAELADRVYSLNADFPMLLPSALDLIKEVLPADARFDDLAAQVLDLLDEDGDLREEADEPTLTLRIAELRAHISETYRLHRRVIRHRRARVLRDEEDAALAPYEVRGRAEPTPLTVTSSYDPAAESLLEWQTQTWGRLVDEDRESARGAYARALCVLASRLGGVSTDYIDALRWRIRRDEDAAQRAGLTLRERTYLADPPLSPHEPKILEKLELELTDSDSDAELNDLTATLRPALSGGGRIVVFCGPGTLATRLAQRLRARFRTASVSEHSRGVGLKASEDAIKAWRECAARKTPVLVVDDSAEDGLNLQIADTVIHLRLPWSPNQLEQRLGRMDRYRGVESLSQSDPARQFALVDAETYSGTWLSLLTDGYEIFSESVSTLQDAIAEHLPQVWSEALEHGPEGLGDLSGSVRSQLAAARRAIDKMDMLESIYDASPQHTDFAVRLGEIEQEWQITRDVLLRYAGDGEGASGIKLRHNSRIINGCECEEFRLSPPPLISPHLYESKRVTAEVARGAFNRSTALRFPGTRIFRVGNPLIDVLSNAIAFDDRGQATAFARFDRDYLGEHEPYFGFDYLVEADIFPALAFAHGGVQATAALRHQADGLLPPFTLKVWVPAGSHEALTDQATLNWLNAPYDNAKDRNFNAKSVHQLTDIFDGRPGYEVSARAAEAVAVAELKQATKLIDRCSRAQEQGRERLAIAKAQAQARRAAGRLLEDRESYAVDVNVTDALVQGLSTPKIQLVAATCVVKTGLIRRVRRGN
ncbi:protein DpdE [Streptomyces globisporus]|uniref:protein DpdE n=1 Tax=Streptomyces globisporus TaxID=1908 RepID=UPI00068C7305|nr:protein DpdE [Streptomyces globisporus]